MDKNEVLRIIQSTKLYKQLGFLHALLPDLLEPEIIITPTQIEECLLPLGASRFGGVPDLPPTFTWPVQQGKPLQFLAQFNLSEIPSNDELYPLPKSGWLYFFLKPNFDGYLKGPESDCRVFYLNPSLTDLVRDTKTNSAPPFKLDFARIFSLPLEDDPRLEKGLTALDNQIELEKKVKYNEQLALYHRRKNEENLKPISPLEWCELSNEERRKRQEIEALYPYQVTIDSYYDSADDIFNRLFSNIRTKQLKLLGLKRYFSLLGVPLGNQVYNTENKRLLLSLDLGSPKKTVFPKDWNWYQSLFFFIARDDLAQLNFDRVECVVDVD